MSEFDHGPDDTWDVGGHDGAHDDVIVAEYTDGSQIAVGDANHDHRPDRLSTEPDEAASGTAAGVGAAGGSGPGTDPGR